MEEATRAERVPCHIRRDRVAGREVEARRVIAIVIAKNQRPLDSRMTNN